MWTEKQAAALSKWPADGTPPLATTPEPDFGAILGLSSKSVDRHVGWRRIIKPTSCICRLWGWLAFEKLARAKPDPDVCVWVCFGLPPLSRKQDGDFVRLSKSFQAFGEKMVWFFLVSGIIITPSHTLW